MRKQMLQLSPRWHVLSFILILLLSAPAWSQSREVIEVSYYKIKGGSKSEWLAPYKKKHLPINCHSGRNFFHTSDVLDTKKIPPK